MEVTDLGLIGSLGPVEELLDQYANNAEARKELIYNLLTSNPYDLTTDMTPKTTIGNNNKVLNAYLLSIGAKYVADSEDPLLDAMKDMTGDQLDKLIDFLRSKPDFTADSLEEAISAAKK